MPIADNITCLHDHFADEHVADLCHYADRGRPSNLKKIAKELIDHCSPGAMVCPFPSESEKQSASDDLVNTMQTLRPDLTVITVDDIQPDDRPVFITLHVDQGNALNAIIEQFPDATVLAFSQRDRQAYLDARQALADKPLANEHDINEALMAIYSDLNNDALLFEGIRLIQAHSVISKKIAEDTLSTVCDFFIDSPHAGLAALMKDIKEQFYKLSLKSVLIKKGPETLFGMQMTNENLKQSIILLPDASEPGRFRASFFDAGGFFSHITRDTYAEILDIVWQENFRPTSEDMLSKLSAMDTWSKGSTITAAIQQVGLGKLSYNEYLAVAQWQHHGDTVMSIANDVKSQAFEPQQRRALLQERSQQSIGLALSDEALDALSAHPQDIPHLTGSLFVSPYNMKASSGSNPAQRNTDGAAPPFSRRR